MQRQKCSATVAQIQVLALLNSIKSPNSLLWIDIFSQNTFLCVFVSIPPVLETSRRMFITVWESSMALNCIGSTIADHFCLWINFCNFVYIYFQNLCSCIFEDHSIPQPVYHAFNWNITSYNSTIIFYWINERLLKQLLFDSQWP